MLGLGGLLAAAQPGAPTLTTQAGTASVILSWTHPGIARFPIAVFRAGTRIATVSIGTSTYTDSGLAAGTYIYQIAYIKNNAVVTRSSTVSGQALAAGPAAPTLTAVTSAGNGLSATVSWTNAGSFTTRIYELVGGSTLNLLTTASAGTTSTTITTTSATTYTIVARHFNGTAESVNSNSINVTTNLGAPSGLTATAVSTTALSLSWSNTDASAPVRVYRGGVLQTTLGAGTTSYSDSGLSANTAYGYAISYFKNSIESSQITATGYTIPNAPTIGTATEPTVGSVTVTWTNAHSLVTYVYRDGSYLGQASAGATSFVDNTVASATAYAYTVRHYNSTSGQLSAASGTASITTALQAPTSLAVTGSTATTMSLSWTNADAGATTQLHRSTTSGSGYSLVATVTAGTNTYTDTGLAEATTYYYVVRHVKNAVNSAFSAQATGTTTLSTTVNAFQLTGRTNTSVSTSWAAPSNGAHYVQLYYAAGTTLGGSPTFSAEYLNSTTAHTFSSLSPATNYTLGARIRSGSVYGGFVSFLGATAPSAVASFTASSSSHTAIDLVVAKNSGETISALVEFRTDPNGSWNTLVVLTTGDFTNNIATYSHTGLNASTTYYYRITPRFTDAASTVIAGTSSTTSAATQAAPPALSITGFSANPSTDQFTLAWNATNVPSGGSVTLAYSWIEVDDQNWQFNSGSESEFTVTGASPYDFTVGTIDVVSGPYPGSASATVTVELRIRNSSGSQVAYASNQLTVDIVNPNL